MLVDGSLLKRVGLEFWEPASFELKEISLRDGTPAKLWVHMPTGHGLLDPFFWEDGDYYREKYRNEFSGNLHSQSTPRDRVSMYSEVNRRQFERFEGLLNSETRYLEIGCSFGGIFRQVHDRGVGSLTAIEPNKEDAGFLKESFPKAIVQNSLLEEANLQGDSFDLIAAFEVLEHVPNPTSFLSKLRKVIAGSGHLVIEVPNHLDALLVNYKSPRYQSFYYHKAHIHYFTPSSLKQLMSRSGFEGDVQGFQMYPFFNQVHWLLNDSPQSNAKSALTWPKPWSEGSDHTHPIEMFFDEVNSKYLELVERELLSDCLIFIGKGA